ncbi:hypothetical protein Tco_0190803 [Tanacetum coccineum]
MTRSDFDAAQIARDAEIARQLQVDLQAKVERERQREEEASKAAIAEMYDRTNLMMTYLKNMGGYKHSQLKAKSFEEIKGMYERQKKSVQDFVPIGSAKEEELIKKTNEKATDEDSSNKEKVLEEPDSTKVKFKQEGHEDSTRKRPGRRLKMKATKKSKREKTDSDLEEEEQLKAFLMINMEQSASTTESLDLMEVLEDELWQNQERWNLKSWDLYENCGVHTLILEDGTEIHMLVERKYSLRKETLKRMLSLRLVVGTASEDAYTLLRFIQKQIDEYGSHDGGEKDF